MWFGIISLFPEMFAPLEYGITGKAIKTGLIQYKIWNPRTFTQDKYKTVDGAPYGGGPGMVMMAGPLQAAIQSARQNAPSSPKVIFMSPQGKVFNQKIAKDFVDAKNESLILVAGRYEGIDERLLQTEIDEEWSIGDYVISGGELAAMVVIDSLTRLIPGALGDEDSAHLDSLMNGLLKYPQYTRPENFDGNKVPQVLLSGDHKKIERWRLKQSLGRTWLRRPDLLAKLTLTREQQGLLTEFIEEYRNRSSHE